jgi:hypothetical protein
MQVIAVDSTQMSNVVLHTGLHPTKGAIERVVMSGKHSGVVRLSWGASSPVPVISANVNNDFDVSYRDCGGLTNPNTAGATGSILVTTTGMASGDEFSITIFMRS